MKFNNINKYLVILSSILLVNINTCFSMENKSKNDDNVVKLGSYDFSNKDDYVVVNQKPDTTIKIKDINTEEENIGKINVRNKTNKIPSRNPFQKKPVLNNNTENDSNNKVDDNVIIVRNQNLMSDPTVSQVFQYSIKPPDRLSKKVVVRRKFKKSNNEITNNSNYNENNLKADITYFENNIFYEPIDCEDDNENSTEHVYDNYYYINCDKVIQIWNTNCIDSLNNNITNSNILNNSIKFMYNNLEINLNKKIEEIIYVRNNYQNTNKFSYYKY